MGPFVDVGDGFTPETGITLAGADQAEVLKANGAATAAMAGTFAAVTGADGWYDYTVATGDVDTVGEVVFVVQDLSVCLPVLVRAQVVEEAIYDALFAASASGFDANGRVDVGAVLGTAQTAGDLAALVNTVDGNVDSILADTGTNGVLVSMSQALPGTPTADTVGDALKQSTREEKAKKNVALSNIAFKMVSSSDNKTGVASLSAAASPQTLTIQQAQDGASSWTTGVGTVVEVGNGIYKYNATQAEMNADTIIFRFAGTGANSTEIAITTVP